VSPPEHDRSWGWVSPNIRERVLKHWNGAFVLDEITPEIGDSCVYLAVRKVLASEDTVLDAAGISCHWPVLLALLLFPLPESLLAILLIGTSTPYIALCAQSVLSWLWAAGS